MSHIKITVSGGLRDETCTYEFDGEVEYAADRESLSTLHGMEWSEWETTITATSRGHVKETRTSSLFTQATEAASELRAEDAATGDIVEAVLAAIGKGTE